MKRPEKPAPSRSRRYLWDQWCWKGVERGVGENSLAWRGQSESQQRSILETMAREVGGSVGGEGEGVVVLEVDVDLGDGWVEKREDKREKGILWVL